MSDSDRSSKNARGWVLLLSFVGEASRRAAFSRKRKRELRSCLWLRDHDPVAVDGLLESALLGNDNKTKLAASGTLLAVADALAQAFSVFDSRARSGTSTKEPTPQPVSSSKVLSVMATASEELPLRELAVSLAERFVPLLAAIAQEAAPPLRVAAPLPSSSAPSGGDGVGDGGGGIRHRAGTSATMAVAAAASTPTAHVEDAPTEAARPTTLTGFAAECALALTSAAALVASSSPKLAVAAAGAAAPTPPKDGGGFATGQFVQARETRREETSGEPPEGAAPGVGTRSLVEQPQGDPAREASLSLSKQAAVVEMPPNDRAPAVADADMAKEDADDCAPTRQRALGVLSTLLPTCTAPLLRLAEAWLGGGVERGGAAIAAPVTAEGELNVSWDEDGGPEAGGGSAQRFGARLGTAPAGSYGGVAVTGGTGQARGLAVTAVRDLTVLVVEGVKVSEALRERHVERVRVLERDGLEERIPATHEEVVLCSGLVEHAAWHLARTVPAILQNRRWPTAKLQAGRAAGGQWGERDDGGTQRSAEVSEIEELVGELRACDPRVLEMAGVEPPQGVEEGRWLALRKLCLSLACAKTKALFHADKSYPEGSRGGGGDGSGGYDLVDALQEALVRSLCSSRPEAQKLGASALVWVMSTALREREKQHISGGCRRSDRSESCAGVDVRPLVGMLGQESGEPASDAAKLVLTGLAMERPLVVVPEVLRAATDAAATPRGDSSDAAPGMSTAPTARFNLTVVLADTLRGIRGRPFPCSLVFHPSQGGGIDREEDIDGACFAKGNSPFDAVGDIGDHLIQCLGSDDLRIGNAASRGLVALDAGWVIPRLCQRLLVLVSGVEDEADQLDQGHRKAVADGIGGAGWGSRRRSAGLQALGDVIVLGRDPPSALAALLDSLRNLAHAAPDDSHHHHHHDHNNANRARGPGGFDDGDSGGGGGGNVVDGAAGSGDGGGGKGEKRERVGGLVDRVMSSLPLWARRLKKRSDRCESIALSRYGRSGGPPSCLACRSSSFGAGAGATAAPAGISSSAAATEGEQVGDAGDDDDDEDDDDDDDNDSESISSAAAAPATGSASPTLFGECLEVAAIKALAAPGEPMPVRFFAVLAAAAAPFGDGPAATAAAADAVAQPAIPPQSTPPTHLSKGVVPGPGFLDTGICSTQGDGAESGEKAAAVPPVAAAGEETEPASKKPVRRRRRAAPPQLRRSTLVGVLEMVRGRMSGQARLSEQLLADESEEASETVRTLLFSRLTPLLLLNAMPPGAVVAEDRQHQQRRTVEGFREGGAGSGGCLEDLRLLLLERTERLYEYDQVQKMSAEIAGILPPRLVLPTLVSRLGLFCEAVEAAEAGGGEVKGRPAGNLGDDDLASPGTLASRALFTACYAVTSHGELVGPWVGLLLSAVVRVALLPAVWDGGDGVDVAQVQHAAVNCVSVLLQTSARTAPSAAKIKISTPTPASRPTALPSNVSRPFVNSTTNACAAKESTAGTCSKASCATAATNNTSTAAAVAAAAAAATSTDATLASKAAAAATTSTDATLASKAAALELSEMNSAAKENKVVGDGAVGGVIIGDLSMTVGDVPGFVASIAVEGILPGIYFEGRGEGGDWLQPALRQAYRREGAPADVDGGGGESKLPAQLRMCFANAVVTAARRCPPEFLPALCRRGNLLGSFLRGASRGGGLLRAACLQAEFALVYRTKDLFGDDSGTAEGVGLGCTCDDVIQVACDALDKEQHPEVRTSGLKLLLGVVAAGASPTAAAASASTAAAPGKGFPTPIREHPEPLISDLDPGRSSTDGTTIYIGEGRSFEDAPRYGGGRGGGGGSGLRVIGLPEGRRRRPGSNDVHVRGAGRGAAGGGAAGILSPAVVSRAKRLLVGVSNIDESADARRLAAQALSALGGAPGS
eukprot:g11467.t1